jgi:competence protein ComEC
MVFNGACTLDVLHPQKERLTGSANNNSLVIRLLCGKYAMLLTGDIEKGAERMLVRAYENIRADLIKVPHHGSSSSSTNALLDKVMPKWAVIQVGAFNKYRHPNQAVIERYQDKGVKVFRTDRHGAVIAWVYEDTILMEPFIRYNEPPKPPKGGL